VRRPTEATRRHRRELEAPRRQERQERRAASRAQLGLAHNEAYTRPRKCIRCGADRAPGGELCADHVKLMDDPEVREMLKLIGSNDEKARPRRNPPGTGRARKKAPEPGGELYCSECDDWRPEAEVEACFGCELSYCHEHRHIEVCTVSPPEAA
jgi:hypothetical protein